MVAWAAGPRTADLAQAVVRTTRARTAEIPLHKFQGTISAELEHDASEDVAEIVKRSFTPTTSAAR